MVLHPESTNHCWKITRKKFQKVPKSNSICQVPTTIYTAFFPKCFIYWTHSMWDLSSPTRDQTYSLHQELRILTTGPSGKSRYSIYIVFGLPGGSDSKESACNAGHVSSIPGLGRFPWRREWLPTPVCWPGEFHGQRSLVGYSPWGHKESETTEHFHYIVFATIYRISTLY